MPNYSIKHNTNIDPLPKRILIVGDAGRGKSTLAKSLSSKLGIACYSTDDFFWKIKFSVEADRQSSLNSISKIYQLDSWIVEGATRSLISQGLKKSNLIIHLVYPSLIAQFWTLLKRKLTRQEEHWINLFRLYRHLILKRYQLGHQQEKTSLEQMLVPYQSKIVVLKTFSEIRNFTKDIGRKST